MVLPTGLLMVNGTESGRRVLKFFVGDDWAEAHHDVEVMDPAGRVLAKARLPEGIAGMARLHAMLAERFGDADPDEVEVVVGTETDRGPWVAALVAAGYQVFAVNPLQAKEYRKRHAVSGAKSDAADAHVLADMVRTDSHQLRTSCARWPVTVPRPRRSRSCPGCTRR
jgi:transposase